MIKTPILQMYYGERGSGALINASPQYREISRKYIDLENEFMEKLNDAPELLEFYNNMVDTSMDMQALFGADCYLEGFRFGAQIALDIMTSPNE